MLTVSHIARRILVGHDADANCVACRHNRKSLTAVPLHLDKKGKLLTVNGDKIENGLVRGSVKVLSTG